MTDRPIITTRPLQTVPEFLAAIELQRQVWPGPDVDVVPLHLLATVAHNGGLVLGAFHGERMVGYLLGFLGTDEGQPSRPAMTRLKHCSHMLGVPRTNSRFTTGHFSWRNSIVACAEV